MITKIDNNMDKFTAKTCGILIIKNDRKINDDK